MTYDAPRSPRSSRPARQHMRWFYQHHGAAYLARLLGISQRRVEQIVDGRETPDHATRLLIHRVLGVELESWGRTL
jgi:transcriptional regulator with XRE-family HTH domain